MYPGSQPPAPQSGLLHSRAHTLGLTRFSLGRMNGLGIGEIAKSSLETIANMPTNGLVSAANRKRMATHGIHQTILIQRLSPESCQQMAGRNP